jgi:hypothetical protein
MTHHTESEDAPICVYDTDDKPWRKLCEQGHGEKAEGWTYLISLQHVRVTARAHRARA